MTSFEPIHARLKAIGYPAYSPLLFIHLDEAKRGERELNNSDLVDLEELLLGMVAELEAIAKHDPEVPWSWKK